jgi:hypothetical protein
LKSALYVLLKQSYEGEARDDQLFASFDSFYNMNQLFQSQWLHNNEIDLYVDESTATGESKPKRKELKEDVFLYAGSIVRFLETIFNKDK